jgi:hypothetical protein
MHRRQLLVGAAASVGLALTSTSEAAERKRQRMAFFWLSEKGDALVSAAKGDDWRVEPGDVTWVFGRGERGGHDRADACLVAGLRLRGGAERLITFCDADTLRLVSVDNSAGWARDLPPVDYRWFA